MRKWEAARIRAEKERVRTKPYARARPRMQGPHLADPQSPWKKRTLLSALLLSSLYWALFYFASTSGECDSLRYGRHAIFDTSVRARARANVMCRIMEREKEREREREGDRKGQVRLAISLFLSLSFSIMTFNSNTIIVSFSGDPMITSSLKGKWSSTIIFFFLFAYLPYRRIQKRIPSKSIWP